MTFGQPHSDVGSSTLRPVYVERVNAVIDFIEQHLHEEMTLEQLADVAHFSSYHFHRLFSGLVGETLNRFINRLRCERAATLLVQQPQRRVTEIGVECGFVNPSSFSRSFRDYFGMSATEWRQRGYLQYGTDAGAGTRDVLGNVGVIGDGYGIAATRISADTGRTKWEIKCGDLGRSSVEIVDLPDLEIAYIRHTGSYQGLGEVFADMFGRLMTWAGPRGLVDENSWVLAVYHDNPSITDDEKLRVSACVDVPASTPSAGEIGRMRLAGGPCAVARFELGVLDYPKAWFAVAAGWLPDSGYEPADRLPFERYPVGAATTSPDKEVVEICIPVRPLRRY